MFIEDTIKDKLQEIAEDIKGKFVVVINYGRVEVKEVEPEIKNSKQLELFEG